MFGCVYLGIPHPIPRASTPHRTIAAERPTIARPTASANQLSTSNAPRRLTGPTAPPHQAIRPRDARTGNNRHRRVSLVSTIPLPSFPTPLPCQARTPFAMRAVRLRTRTLLHLRKPPPHATSHSNTHLSPLLTSPLSSSLKLVTRTPMCPNSLGDNQFYFDEHDDPRPAAVERRYQALIEAECEDADTRLGLGVAGGQKLVADAQRRAGTWRPPKRRPLIV